MVNPDWQRLVEENLDLARSVAWRYARKGLAGVDPALDLDDLIAAAFEGLIWAARRYDPTLGWRFSTVAVLSIRGYVLRLFRRHRRGIKLPVSHEWGRGGPYVCSLDMPVGEDGDSTLGDLVGATGHGEVEAAVLAGEVLAGLPERLRLVLQFRAFGFTQQQVARRLGCSQAQVSRLEQIGKRQLMAAIGK